VKFAKFAGAVLAIFLTLTLSFYGFDIKQVRKEIEDTHVESQKLALDIKQAKGDLARETTEIQKERADIQNKMADIKKDVESTDAAAKVVSVSLGIGYVRFCDSVHVTTSRRRSICSAGRFIW
jgi:uncharacterized protein YlxW (UPF0749 family)